MPTVRTYETFEIQWGRGSRWSNYSSAAEAQAVIDGAVLRGSDRGEVVAHRFSVELDPRLEEAGMYLPGIADRVFCRLCEDDFYRVNPDGVCDGCIDEAAGEETERWAQDR